MNCQEIEKHLLDYMDNECPSSINQLVEEHLNSCAQCRSEVSAYKKTSLFLQLRSVPQPNELYWEQTFDKVMDGVKANVVDMPKKNEYDITRNSEEKSSLLRSKVMIALSVAATILVGVLSYTFYQSEQPDEQFNRVITIEREWRAMPAAQPMYTNFEPDEDFSAFSRAAMGTVDQVSRGAVIIKVEELTK